MSKAKEEVTEVTENQVEEITEFPEQNTFNTDDMSVIVEEDEENGN